ncbi:hypothetical protein ACWGJ2_02130 [Streptomyces sp. NPDC054796]
MTQTARRGSASGEGGPDAAEKLALLKWHLDRYDRLRVSTASRAAVVLSAGAILSAGDAVLLTRLLEGANPHLDSRLALVFGLGLLGSIGLLVLSLVHATGVLVTLKASRDVFADMRDLPPGLIFNDSDTVRELATFDDFKATVDTQDYPAMVRAAQVELWIGIRQHRHRYLRLRAAARMLRWAAAVFLLSAGAFVVTVLVHAATR